MSNPPSDGQLISRLQSGDLDALGVLYERHRKKVYRTALSVTGDPAAAEDVLQDCFLRVHRYADSVDSSLPLQPWLYRVAINQACDWKSRRRPAQVPLDGEEEHLAVTGFDSPEHHAEVNDLRRRMGQMLSTLSDEQRVVLILFYLHALDLQEIADLLDCPVGTVKSRLFYGRLNLKRRIMADGYEYI